MFPWSQTVDPWPPMNFPPAPPPQHHHYYPAPLDPYQITRAEFDELVRDVRKIQDLLLKEKTS